MVASRMKEFGIRRTLGADAVRILELVARSALLIVAVGTAAGLLVAYPLAGVLQSRLFGVGTLDVTSYLGAAALLVLAALAACAAPARAALRVDPVTALREE
jgi:ABC-type antimicrobial peptide transport system permease subunit